MIRISKTILLFLALMGTVFTCASHRELEESSSEAEETEVELLISRRTDVGRTRPLKLNHANQISRHGLSESISRAHFDVRPISERDQFNGIGAFLII